MRLANFELPADKHGRHTGLLEPSGGTLTVAISAAANGGFLPGDRNVLQEQMHIIRITATKDCYIRFSSGAVQGNATANDILYLAGTESTKLPSGTSFISGVVLDPAETGQLSVTVMA